MEIGSIENLPNRGEVITRSTGGQNVAPGDRVLGQVVASDGSRGCEYCSLRIPTLWVSSETAASTTVTTTALRKILFIVGLLFTGMESPRRELSAGRIERVAKDIPFAWLVNASRRHEPCSNFLITPGAGGLQSGFVAERLGTKSPKHPSAFQLCLAAGAVFVSAPN
jgi:hypothetical protein